MDHVVLADLPSVAPEGSLLIPKLLHMIWVGDAPAPLLVEVHRAAWVALLGPEWTVRLWTNDDIAEFPAHVQEFIGRALKGVEKADILRYYIVEKYGGIYIDTDMAPHRSLDPIVWMQKPLVICHDIPVTWPYIINAMFAASPNNPVLRRCCELVLRGTLNTGRPHFETGPRVFGEAIHQCNTESITCLPIQKFYHNAHDEDRLATHLYSRQWDV